MTTVIITIWFAIVLCVLALLVSCFQLLPKLREYDEEEFKRAGYLGSFMPGLAIRKQARFFNYVLKKEYSKIEDSHIVKRFTVMRAFIIAKLVLLLMFFVCLLYTSPSPRD